MALSMRVLKTTPGFHDSSKPQDRSRAARLPGPRFGAGCAVSNDGTMRGASDFGYACGFRAGQSGSKLSGAPTSICRTISRISSNVNMTHLPHMATS